MLYKDYDSSRKYRYVGNNYKVNAEMMRIMNIPVSFWRASKDELFHGESDEVTQIFSVYWENLQEALDSGYGLVINGEYGTGKTSAAVICLKHVKSIGGSGFYVTVSDYIKAVFERHMYNSSVSVEGRSRDVDLLVIDDIGKEAVNLGTERDASAMVVASLVRDRRESLKSTIITTNLSQEQLFKFYGNYFLESIKDKMRGVTLTNIKRNCSAVEDFWSREVRHGS